MSDNKQFVLAISTLNQWALDFAGNTQRILTSIKQAKAAAATYRLGNELELTGYGCEDHFLEADTYTHSWECLALILRATLTDETCRDIVCDISMPVQLDGLRYNCRVLLLNGCVFLIRPKLTLPTSGMHRESRWFTPWHSAWKIVDFELPEVVRAVSGQIKAPFGCSLLRFNGVIVGLETCEELWTGDPSPHKGYYAAGAEIILNASASHHELRKIHQRIELIRKASMCEGSTGVYAYSNGVGCDSNRVCYDGGALVAMDGELICMGPRLILDEVYTSIVSLPVSKFRPPPRPEGINFLEIPSCPSKLPPPISASLPPRISLQPQNMCSAVEEIALGPALWLWDILRRSGAGGFFLCLSGGLDSASVACIVFSMCQRVTQAVRAGNNQVLETCRRLVGDETYSPDNPRELCSRLFTTCYMPSSNSTPDTQRRAAHLALAIGGNHMEINIDNVVLSSVNSAIIGLNATSMPQFQVYGGSRVEDLALQNVQARSRMVLSYLSAQLLSWSRNQQRNSGSEKALNQPMAAHLILSSANLDECLFGYLTKYDCSSADLNPIGNICKEDIRLFVSYAVNNLFALEFDSAFESSDSTAASYAQLFSITLTEILSAPATAELTPLDAKRGLMQTDEADMGLTYAELSLFGRLRKQETCGPVSMLNRLLEIQKNGNTRDRQLSAHALADKVKLFFRKYASNRHKSTVLPPAYHIESYNADDNRFDFRPFLYPTDWTHQFLKMDAIVDAWEASH